MNTFRFRFKSILATLALLIGFSGGAFGEDVIVGTGTETSFYVPFTNEYHNGTAEMIYTPTELGGAGVITAIAHNVASANSLSSTSIKIYMGHRSSATYGSTSDYAPASELTLVYSGNPTIGASTGWQTFTLTTPFVYNGTDNLEVVICRQGSSWNKHTYYVTSASNKALYRWNDNDSGYGDVTNTSYSFNSYGYRPNTKFTKSGGQYTKNNIKYVYVNSEAYVIGTDSPSGAVTIPSTIQPGDGKTYNVVGISGNAFKGCTGITSISIPSSVTSFGKNIFDGCSNLTTITIPSSMTALPNGFFKGCTGLKSYSIPSTVTSIGANLFEGCSSLTSVIIPSSITTLPSYLFKGCTGLKSYNIPSTVTSIGTYLFSGCTNLTSVTIPSSITKLPDHLFYGCTGLKAYSIPSTVTYIGGFMFGECTNLASVTIPSSITTLPYGLFSGCTGLKTFSIPSTVTSIGAYMFSGCTNLTSVTIPSSIKTFYEYTFKDCASLSDITIPSSVDSLGYDVFYNCTSLKNITLQNTDTKIYAASIIPYDCAIYVPTSAVATYKTAAKWSSHKDQIMAVGTKTDYDLTGTKAVTAESGMSVLHSRIGEDHLAEVISLKVEGTINSYDLMVMRNKMTRLRRLDLSKATIVANSYEYYQGYCSKDNTLSKWSLNDSLYSVKLPESLTTIETYAFVNLKHLGSIEIPANVTSIATYAFSGMTSLKSASFATGSKCTTIGNCAFYNNTNLTSVTFGNNAKIGTIGQSAFSSCSKLASFDFGSNTTCTTIGQYAFQDCSSLSAISIPASVTTINSYAFSGCSALKNLTFEDGETSLALIGSGYGSSQTINGTNYNNYSPFQNCPIQNLYIGRKLSYNDYSYYYTRLCTSNTSLQSVEFGEYASTIDAAQFAGCTNLTEVKGLENINSIGQGAFYNCTSLTSLTIPSNVTTVEPWAFRSSGLTSMNIPSGITSLGAYAFADCSSLTSFTFDDDCQLTTIPNYFLYNATKLNDIALPKSTLTIGNYAFYGCTQMQECKISSKITKIGDYAFNQCNNLNSVYAYTYEPQAIDQNTFSTYKTATLHIPSTSYLLYFYDTQWSQFLKLVGFDSEAEQVGINVDYHLYTETNGIIGGKPRVDISGKGGLTVEGNKVQPCGDIHIACDDNYFGSIIANGNVTADKLYFDITVSKDKWYFFCFPFDIPLANITKGGSYKWAEYDGSVRATSGTTGWKNLAAGTTKLTKGKGYIFRTNYAGELSLRVDAPTFNAVNEQTILTSYVSETAANADWNMVGNPFPCYYPINKMEYGAPIIVWNGSSYDAYRPGDDDYTFHPFEAFFVQKPQSVSYITFPYAYRQTYQGSHPTSSSAKTGTFEFEGEKYLSESSVQSTSTNRQLVNLTLSYGDLTDKTRVVFNDNQSVDYEQECDAAKFETIDAAPQLYSLGADGTKYAINERPVANGKVALGFYAPEDGMYTFAAPRMDADVYIYDAETGNTYDLSAGSFTFNASQGTDNNRFTLIFASDSATGINGINATAKASIYDLNGRKVNDAAQKGVYIVNGKKVVKK